MIKKNIIILVAVIVLILVVGGGVYVLNNKKTNTQNPTTTKNGVEGSGNFNVNVDPIPAATGSGNTSAIQAPNLDRPIVVSDATISAASADIAKKQIITDISIVKKDSSNIAAWMELAANFRFIGDYKTTEEILKYIVAKSPKYSVALNNLAILYQQNLKNYFEAERYFLRYIDIQPSDANAYIALAGMYRYQYLAKADKADDILLQGLQKNVGNTQLLVELAHYYRDTNDFFSARTYYNQAIAAADKANNTSAAASLRIELTNLPK